MRTLSWKPAIKSVLLITCIAALIIAPWTYRNYRVTHTFVLVSTGLGEVLLGAYNDKVLYGDQNSRGMWSPPSDALNHDALNYTSDNDKSDTQRALSWVKAHLSSMPYLFSLHFVQTWIPYTYSHGLPMEEFPARLSSRILGYILPISSILIDIGAAIGVLVTWKRWKRQLLCVYLLVAITLIQNIIFYGDMRFRSPIEPYLVIFFAGMLVWLIQHGPEKLILKFITHPKKAPSEPFSSHSPLPITLLEEGHPE